MLSAAAPSVTAGDVLTLPELQHLRRVSGVRSAALVLHAWAAIAGAMALYAVWPSVLTLVAAVAVIGARQLGLLVLMHDGAHWRLFPHPKGLLARIFVAPYWVNYHLEHHLFVFVPCWKLRQAHAILLARGFGARMETSPSYLDVIRRATSAR